MPRFSYQSGKYQLTLADVPNATVYLYMLESEARFMYTVFARLGFSEIKCIEKMSPANVQKYQKLYQNK